MSGDGDIATSQAARSGHDNPYSGRPARQWILVAILLVLTMLSTVDRQILGLLIEPVRGTLKLTDTQASLLLGLSFASVYILVTPLAGWMADRWPRRVLVGAGAMIWSVGTMCCGLASGYWPLFLARMGVGGSEAFLTPAANSMVRDAVDETKRGRAFALMAMALPVGAGAAMLIGGALMGAIEARSTSFTGILASLETWQLTLLAVGILGLPLGLLVFLVAEPRRASSHDSQKHPTFREAFVHLRGNWRPYAAAWGFLISSGMIATTVGSWLPAMLARNWGMSQAQIGLQVGTAIFVLAPVGLWIGGVLIDQRFRSPRGWAFPAVVIAGTLGICAPGILAPVAPSLAVFWVLFCIQILTAGLPQPVVNTRVADLTPSRLMGRVVGIQIFIHGLATAVLAPTLVALLADHLFHGGPRALAYAMSTNAIAWTGVAIVCGVAVVKTRNA